MGTPILHKFMPGPKNYYSTKLINNLEISTYQGE